MAILDLPDNHLGSAGVEAVASAVRGNRTITRLNLARNRVSPTEPGAANGLAELLQGNRVLSALNVAGNNFGDRGAKQARLTDCIRAAPRSPSFPSALQAAPHAQPPGVRQILDVALVAAGYALAELDVSETGAGGMSVSSLASLIKGGLHLRRIGVSGLLLPTSAWARAPSLET